MMDDDTLHQALLNVSDELFQEKMVEEYFFVLLLLLLSSALEGFMLF